MHGTIVERLARRYLAEKSEVGDGLARTVGAGAVLEDSLRLAAMDKISPAGRWKRVPAPLAATLDRLWQQAGADPSCRFALRLGSAKPMRRYLRGWPTVTESQAVRLAFIAAVGQGGRAERYRFAAAVG